MREENVIKAKYLKVNTQFHSIASIILFLDSIKFKFALRCVFNNGNLVQFLIDSLNNLEFYWICVLFLLYLDDMRIRNEPIKIWETTINDDTFRKTVLNLYKLKTV